LSADKDRDDLSEDLTSVAVGGTFTKNIRAAELAPPSLVLIVGPQKLLGRQWLIDRKDLIIGRSAGCDIYIEDKSLSRTHSKISNDQGVVTVTDMESTNKTYVNARRIEPFVSATLTHNDRLKVGNVLFKFIEEGNPEALAHQNLQIQTDRDSLTQIWSKGALLLKAPEIFQKAKIVKEPLSVIVFDIDHFKRINDTYGHPAGDYILKELALVVGLQLIRSDDFFARYGGEEFVIFLMGSDEKKALEISERIRVAIESHKFDYQGTTIPVTVSLGVSLMRDTDTSWEELFERGDQALYKSKSQGRNRVSKG
jgi:two-component system cell cycle response regulator